MESLMLNKTIQEADYLDYIYGIANIFRLSSSDRYIIFSMKVEENQCTAKMTIYDQEGISKEYQDVTINCGDSFYDSFLKVLVLNIEEVAQITKKDIVNLDGDEYVAFRMITSHNDLFTIDGLEKHQAEELLKSSDDTSNTVISNRSGHSSFVQLLLMIGILSISFIAIVMLVD